MPVVLNQSLSQSTTIYTCLLSFLPFIMAFHYGSVEHDLFLSQGSVLIFEDSQLFHLTWKRQQNMRARRCFFWKQDVDKQMYSNPPGLHIGHVNKFTSSSSFTKVASEKKKNMFKLNLASFNAVKET